MKCRAEPPADPSSEKHELTGSTLAFPTAIPHAPEVASGVWGMDGGVHGWVVNCSTPPTRDETVLERAPGTYDLYSENPTR
jgi:hypothetical protein